MTNLEIVAVAMSALAFAAVVTALVLMRAHYEALLRDVRADNRDLRDRMYLSKGQPPAGVDVRAAHEEKQAERRARASDPALKSAPDPTWKMRRQLAENEKRRAGQSK